MEVGVDKIFKKGDIVICIIVANSDLQFLRQYEVLQARNLSIKVDTSGNQYKAIDWYNSRRFISIQMERDIKLEKIFKNE